jgi:predicted nucleic acid-binding protein
MYLVDSSVWIDYFIGKPSMEADYLSEHLDEGQFMVGDLILAEVLQGTNAQSDFDRVLRLLSAVEQIQVSDRAIAIQAAQHFRTLRAHGITIRKTIDTLIATRCIADGIPLLFSDRDFDPFVKHLGLVSISDGG